MWGPVSEGKSSMVVAVVKYASDESLEMLLAPRECVCASVFSLRCFLGEQLTPGVLEGEWCSILDSGFESMVLMQGVFLHNPVGISRRGDWVVERKIGLERRLRTGCTIQCCLNFRCLCEDALSHS